MSNKNFATEKDIWIALAIAPIIILRYLGILLISLAAHTHYIQQDYYHEAD